MKKLDFGFEDLMFSLRCGDDDEKDLLNLGNMFLEKVRDSKSKFPTLSSKNAVFITALTILSEHKEAKKALKQERVHNSIPVHSGTSKAEIVACLMSLLEKVRKIKCLVRDDMFIK